MQLTQPAPAPGFPLPDFDFMLSMRPALLRNCHALPAYLLLPEIESLLTAMPNQHARMLTEFLWMTGARINEALAFKYRDAEPISTASGQWLDITLRTLKQRTGHNGQPRRGRPRLTADQDKGPAIRSVPVECPGFARQLDCYRRTFRRTKDQPLFVNPQTGKSWSAQRVRDWLAEAGDTLAGQGRALPVKVTPHIFRHSYAIHLLLHHVRIETISKLLGHSSLRSTQVYLNIWQAERFSQVRGVAFRMPLAPD